MQISLFHHNFNIFAFENKEMDSLYYTSALLKFAKGLISVFVPIYLFNLGFPIWQILGFYLLRSVYYLIFSNSLLGILKKLSDKMMMALAIPFLVLYFLGLNILQEPSLLFLVLPAAEALNMLLFWVGYHTDFSEASSQEHVGEEIGAKSVIVGCVKFITPFVGGVLISYFNFHYVFLIASLILILAIVPLFFFPKRNMLKGLEVKDLWNHITSREYLSFNISSFSYGSEKMVKVIIWPLFLFLILGGVEKLGGVLSLGLLFGAGMTYFIGRKTDRDISSRKKFLKNSGFGLSLVWIAKSFLSRITKAIPFVGLHIISDMLRRSIMVNWRRKFYLLAQKNSSPSSFVLAQEMIYHIARVTILPIFMIFASLLSLKTFFLASFILASILSLGFISSTTKEV